MYNADDKIITDLLVGWHCIERDLYRAEYPSLPDYDVAYAKTAKQRRKYICLDDGGSGAFVVDRQTGEIYRVKAYGAPNKKKLVGNIANITPAVLASYSWLS